MPRGAWWTRVGKFLGLVNQLLSRWHVPILPKFIYLIEQLISKLVHFEDLRDSIPAAFEENKTKIVFVIFVSFDGNWTDVIRWKAMIRKNELK